LIDLFFISPQKRANLLKFFSVVTYAIAAVYKMFQVLSSQNLPSYQIILYW